MILLIPASRGQWGRRRPDRYKVFAGQGAIIAARIASKPTKWQGNQAENHIICKVLILGES